MKKIFVTLLVLSSVNINGQNNSLGNRFEKKNNLLFELGGHGLLYSIGYERTILNGARFKTLASISGAYYPEFTNYIEFWLPVSISEVVSFGSHHVQLGVGYTFINFESRSITGEYERTMDGFVTPSLYYRFQRPSGKIMFKAGFTPFFERNQNGFEFYPSGGVGVGYLF